jgi:hypothetical protein
LLILPLLIQEYKSLLFKAAKSDKDGASKSSLAKQKWPFGKEKQLGYPLGIILKALKI